MNIIGMQVLKNESVKSVVAFCFLFWLSGSVTGLENEFDLIMERIRLNGLVLENGRIEISANLEIIDDYDTKSELVGESYFMNQDFIWIFRDKRWRIEQQMKDSNEESYNIQVFDGEKKTDLFINSSTKMALVTRGTKYVPTPYTRTYGSPGMYMFDLISDGSAPNSPMQGFLSKDLTQCQDVKLIGTEKVNGIECKILQFVYFMDIPEELAPEEFKDGKIPELKFSGSLWVAPSKGYAVIKSVINEADNSQFIRVAKDLREWTDGIWLPTRGSFVHNRIYNGQVIPNVRVDFVVNSIELTEVIDEGSFQLEFPPGTSVVGK